jgi:hypothetical protein
MKDKMFQRILLNLIRVDLEKRRKKRSKKKKRKERMKMIELK